MLIDIYQKWGMDIVAQTDLDQRVHKNQSTVSLGKMSFGILQTFFDRLGKYKGISVQPDSLLLRQITQDQNEQHQINEIRIEEYERPPMTEVDAYKKTIKKK